MLKKNDIVRIKICDITNLGFGVGKHEGQIVFCQDAIEGDEIDCKIIKVNKSYAVGRIDKIITRSELYTDKRCGNRLCRSCAYKNLPYEKEIEYKENVIRRAFAQASLSEVNILGVIPSPVVYEYRNKAQYPVSIDKNGDYVIGFYAPKSHRVTEARYCPLTPRIFGEICDVLADHFKLHGVSVYDEERGGGLLRHIYIRRGEVTGEILITLVVNGTSLPAEHELTEKIRTSFPSVVGILINENFANTNVILGEKYRTVYGRDFIYDTLCGVRLKITAQSFYQVNRAAAEILYGKALELANPKKDDTVLDLYCGAGSIGLSFADKTGDLIGVEIVESAVKCAAENAAANGKNNAKFYTGDATDTEKLLSNAERELGKKIYADIIVLDPPRAGCEEKLIKFVARLSPRKVVYISCNPSTLARDCAIFKSLGYTADSVLGVDLFPGTGHVESVVCLTRRLDN